MDTAIRQVAEAMPTVPQFCMERPAGYAKEYEVNKMVTRYVMVRAKNRTQAKTFGKQVAKYSTMDYSPERVGSVTLNKAVGLAGGIPGYTVGLTKRKVERYKTGKKKNMLRPRYNK